MRIEKLELNNFRGFEHLEIEFPKEEAGLAVLIGVNGSGKSSVLEAIVSFFEGGMNRIMNKKKETIHSDLDVHLDSYYLKNIIDFCFLKDKGEQAVTSYYLTDPELNQRENGASFFFRKLLKKIEEIDKYDAINIPLIVFYGTRRKLENQYSEQSIKRYLIPQFKAYENTLSAGLNFLDFETWFVERENQENRGKIKNKDFNYVDFELQQVKDAIDSFFADWNIKNLRVDGGKFSAKTNVLYSLGIDKDNKTFNLSQLSDGEKMALLLVTDIARRLIIANPNLEKPLTGEGLVLIDEIDLHLHPAWQRKIIPNLRKTFPNIQFIVTTHSPQVLSSVNKENVFILEDFKVVKNTPHTLGRDSNSILADVFSVGSRPEFSKQEFEELYKLIDDPKKEKEAKIMLERMREKYGVEDSEVVQAGLHLEFLTD